MDIVLNPGLPLFGIVMLTLLFTICFSCYMCRLKCMNLKEKEMRQGFRLVTHEEHEEKGFQQCPVCLEEYNKGSTIAITHCGHVFHYKCLAKWLPEKNTCPLCMGQVGLGWDVNDQLITAIPPLTHVV